VTSFDENNNDIGKTMMAIVKAVTNETIMTTTDEKD